MGVEQFQRKLLGFSHFKDFLKRNASGGASRNHLRKCMLQCKDPYGAGQYKKMRLMRGIPVRGSVTQDALSYIDAHFPSLAGPHA